MGPGVPPPSQEPRLPCFFQVKMRLAVALLPKSAPDPFPSQEGRAGGGGPEAASPVTPAARLTFWPLVLQPWGCPPGLPGQHPGQDHSVRH